MGEGEEEYDSDYMPGGEDLTARRPNEAFVWCFICWLFVLLFRLVCNC